MKKGICTHCQLECQGIHCLKSHEATCMDQQQQVLKEYKKDADQDIVLWLNSNAEVSQSASRSIPACLLPDGALLLTLCLPSSKNSLPPLSQPTI
jgi:hypothetical protein